MKEILNCSSTHITFHSTLFFFHLQLLPRIYLFRSFRNNTNLEIKFSLLPKRAKSWSSTPHRFQHFATILNLISRCFFLFLVIISRSHRAKYEWNSARAISRLNFTTLQKRKIFIAYPTFPIIGLLSPRYFFFLPLLSVHQIRTELWILLEPYNSVQVQSFDFHLLILDACQGSGVEWRHD